MRARFRSLIPMTAVFLILFTATSLKALTPPPIGIALPDDLIQKYNHYRDEYMKRHIDRGGAVEALLDDETKSRVIKYWGMGDSQGWTGLTMAAFAFQGDWDLVRTNLTYWPLLEIEPGKYKRFPEHPNNDPDPTSIDQYGEMLMGIAAVWLLGPDDLKKQVAGITKNMIIYGKNHNWKMGEGPYTDCQDIRFLFILLNEKMGLGLDLYEPGETNAQARERFLVQFKKAIFVRRTPRYFTLNLFFERMFVAKLLAPDLPGLDGAIKEWYKVVAKDDDTMFDWFFARVTGKDTSFVIDKLRDFPANLPNEWEQTGYNLGYRWERSPEEKNEKADGRSIEYSGMDFLALASFYAYFAENDFGKYKSSP